MVYYTRTLLKKYERNREEEEEILNLWSNPSPVIKGESVPMFFNMYVEG